MYPRDNIFNIYYNIGRRVPFQVKRSRSMNADFRHSKDGKTFAEVYKEDPQYIEWFVRNNDRLDLDADSFRSLWQK